MPFNQAQLPGELNKTISGTANSSGANAANAYAEHFALHTWLRAQNAYDNSVQLGNNVKSHSFARLQVALNVVQKILLESDNDAQETNRSAGFFQDTVIQALLPNIQQNEFNEYSQAFGSAATSLTNKQYAEMLLNDINNYIARHGLSAFNLTEEQESSIQQQVGILKNAQASIAEQITLTKNPTQNPFLLGLDFTLRAAVLLFTLPFAMVGAFFYAGLQTIFGKALRNSDLVREGFKPADTRYENRVNDNLRDDPELKNNPVAVGALTLASALINAITASVFVPLRWLVGYEGWQPQNQARLDAVEKGIYNVLISPFQAVVSVVYHVGKNLYRTWFDTDNVFAEIDKNKIPDKKYGLGFFRFDWFTEPTPSTPLRWYQFTKREGFRRGLARVLNLALLPVDLLVGVTFSILRCALAYPLWNDDAKAAFDKFETAVYALAAAAWLGFLTVIFAPIVFGAIGSAIAWPIAQALVGIHNLIWGSSVAVPSIGVMFHAVAGWSIGALTTSSGAMATLFTGLGNGIVTAATGAWTGVTAAANAIWGFVTKFTLALYGQNVFGAAAAAATPGSTTAQLSTMARLMTFVGLGLGAGKAVSVAIQKGTGPEAKRNEIIDKLNGIKDGVMTGNTPPPPPITPTSPTATSTATSTSTGTRAPIVSTSALAKTNTGNNNNNNAASASSSTTSTAPTSAYQRERGNRRKD